MKHLSIFTQSALSLLILASSSYSAEPSKADEFRGGKNFIETKVYSAEEDQAILKKFEGLRVADVSDGMDFVGLPDAGLMNPEIHPLWKDTETYAHRIIGIAVTTRYVPTMKPRLGRVPVKEFDQWVGQTYSRDTHEPFGEVVRPGSVVVIDEADGEDVGSVGSNNIMAWVLSGCVGVITDLSVRDTDEIITEKVPVYLKQPGRGIRPGRNEIESVNRPIVCGGVLVMPGDVIVADGDGVIVVPRAVAEEVAEYAHAILKGDKEGRRGLYKKLGLPEDDSVR